MANPLLTRQKQVLAKVETTHGTPVSLANTDGGCRISTAAAIEPQQPTYPRDIARFTLSPLGDLPGEKAGGITLRTELNTPDDITATALEFKTFLRGCSMTVTAAHRIAIGAVSNGPYVAGETVTDATGYQGIVGHPCADGDGALYYGLVTTALSTAETLTGGTSGATATSSSGGVSAGYYAKPISDNQEALTLELQQDGYAWSITGAMGTFEVVCEASRAGYLDFNFTGAKSTYGYKAMTTGITYQTEQPPILQGAALTINEVTPVVHSARLVLGNNVVLRPDGNATSTGYLASYIPGREPKINLTVEMQSAATLDVFGLLSSGSKVPISWRVGTATGKIIWISAYLCQLINISVGDSDGLATVDLEFKCTGGVNGSEDELGLLFI